MKRLEHCRTLEQRGNGKAHVHNIRGFLLSFLRKALHVADAKPKKQQQSILVVCALNAFILIDCYVEHNKEMMFGFLYPLSKIKPS